MNTHNDIEDKITQARPEPLSDAERALLWSRIARRMSPRSLRTRARRYRPLFAGVGIAALLFGSGAGAVFASDAAVPGDMLFPVDIAVEQARIAFARDDRARTLLEVDFAEERLGEVKRMLAIRSGGNAASGTGTTTVVAATSSAALSSGTAAPSAPDALSTAIEDDHEDEYDDHAGIGHDDPELERALLFAEEEVSRTRERLAGREDDHEDFARVDELAKELQHIRKAHGGSRRERALRKLGAPAVATSTAVVATTSAEVHDEEETEIEEEEGDRDERKDEGRDEDRSDRAEGREEDREER